MSVTHDILVTSVAFNNVNIHWRLSFGKEIVSLDSLNLELVNIVIDKLGALLDFSISKEGLTEHGRQVRDLNELRESLDIPVIPPLLDSGFSFLSVNLFVFDHKF